MTLSDVLLSDPFRFLLASLTLACCCGYVVRKVAGWFPPDEDDTQPTHWVLMAEGRDPMLVGDDDLLEAQNFLAWLDALPEAEAEVA